MRTFALALLLLQPAALRPALAADRLPTALTGEKTSSNPADYPIAVHVIWSRYVPTAAAQGYQQLDAVIDGQQVELKGENGSGVLLLTGYKAQLHRDNTTDKHFNGYDIGRIYRFLLPDGTIRDFDLIGLGPKDSAATAPLP